MKILELFSGTGSFSNIARERGHEVFTVEIDPQFKPHLCKDILEVTSQEILDKFGQPDIIWASPPCTCFSVASIGRYWLDGKPKNEKTLHAIKIVEHTLKLIRELNPKFWIMENPRGMLRKQDVVKGLNRATVTYCQYGSKIQKPTDLFNNLSSWIARPMCKPGAPCHERASRGARNGLQGINNSFSNLGSRGKVARAIVPPALCKEIIEHCEANLA